MATATMALKISDGTTTVDLIYHSISNPGYQLTQDWAPSVAKLRSNELGDGPYENVIEEIVIRIFGTSAADAYAKAHTLNVLLDQAERWWLKKQGVTPVTLRYSPPGATVSTVAAPLQAVILGRGGDDGMLSLPPTFNKLVNGYIIDGIRLRLLRRQWVGANDAVTAGASGQATPITITYATTHPVSSPITLRWLGFSLTTTPIIRPGYAIVGSQASDIQVFEAEAGTATAYTSVADSANNARGGSVLRYTPTGTAAALSGGFAIPSSISGTVAILAAVRNNSGSTTFQIAANIYGLGALSSIPAYLIDASSTQPRLVLLGTTVVSGAVSMNLSIAASAASGSLDIDYFILVNLRDETVAVVAFDQFDLTTVLSGSVTLEMDFTYNPLTSQAPVVTAQNSAGTVAAPLTTRGPLPFQTIGINLYALWCSTNGASWRFTTAAAAVLAPTPSVVRYKTYLVPQ